jgi:hypothetical protein
MWTEGLESGSLSTEDIIHLKECLTKLDCTVLPTAQDKWVSLDPSFGLVCWSDDKNLRKIFKNFSNIEFLYFGNLSGSEQEMLQTKVSLLLQKLGIPALSEVSAPSLPASALSVELFSQSLMETCKLTP